LHADECARTRVYITHSTGKYQLKEAEMTDKTNIRPLHRLTPQQAEAAMASLIEQEEAEQEAMQVEAEAQSVILDRIEDRLAALCCYKRAEVLMRLAEITKPTSDISMASEVRREIGLLLAAAAPHTAPLPRESEPEGEADREIVERLGASSDTQHHPV
jgi:hypothetical protein